MNNQQVMRLIAITLLFLFFIDSIHSQGNARANTPSFTNQASQSGLNGMSRAMRTVANMNAQYRYGSISEEYNEIDGSPYFTPDTVLSTLIMNDGNLLKDVPLKIDLYVNEIIATDENGDDIILDGKFYSEIKFKNDGEIVSFKRTNPKKPHTFYQVLYESDNLILYKSQVAKLRKGENLGIAQTKSIFKKQVKYYIIKPGQSPIRVSLQKKSIFPHFSLEESKKIDDFIQANDITLKKGRDLLHLFSTIQAYKERANSINRP